MTEQELQHRVSESAFPRRRLLRDGALLTGAAVAAVSTPEGIRAAGAPWSRLTPRFSQSAIESYQPVALTADELTTLKAMVGRLIPTDDLGPGAVDAGAFIAMDQALTNRNKATLPLYQGGLAALDKAAGTGGFAALAPEKQDAILTDAEKGNLADAPDGFFALIREHTLQGMFGDPVRGGNIDFAGWDLVGFPGIKLVWTEADQVIGATVAREHKSVKDYGGDAP